MASRRSACLACAPPRNFPGKTAPSRIRPGRHEALPPAGAKARRPAETADAAAIGIRQLEKVRSTAPDRPRRDAEGNPNSKEKASGRARVLRTSSAGCRTDSSDAPERRRIGAPPVPDTLTTNTLTAGTSTAFGRWQAAACCCRHENATSPEVPKGRFWVLRSNAPLVPGVTLRGRCLCAGGRNGRLGGYDLAPGMPHACVATGRSVQGSGKATTTRASLTRLARHDHAPGRTLRTGPHAPLDAARSAPEAGACVE